MSDPLQADYSNPAVTPPRPAAAQAAGLSSLLLDELNCGVVLVDQQGTILHANRTGRSELMRCHVLGEANGSLYALAIQDGKALQAALDRTADGKRGLVNLRASGREMSIVLVPLPDQSAKGAHRVALYFARNEVCETSLLGFFASTYRLTPAEEQVLAILVQGYNAPEAATLLDVAVSTVRTHVRNLCSKTQSGGIRELVSRVAVLPPVASAGPAGHVH